MIVKAEFLSDGCLDKVKSFLLKKTQMFEMLITTEYCHLIFL